MKTEFPEKWYLEVSKLSENEQEIVGKYFDKKSGNHCCWNVGSYAPFIKSHNEVNQSIVNGVDYGETLNATFAGNEFRGTEIIFEQFEQFILNPKKMYSIEEIKSGSPKLVVKLETEEQFNQLKKLFPDELMDKWEGPIHYDLWKNGNWPTYTKKEIEESIWNCTVITFDQIQLKETKMENKKLLGYRLVKTEFEKAVNTLADGVNCSDFKRAGRDYYEIGGNSQSIQNFKDAGVLDLWFEPVYEEKYKYKVGDYVVWSLSGEVYLLKKYEGNDQFLDSTGDHRDLTLKEYRLATQEEIDKFEASFPKIIIEGYNAEKTEKGVKFGCQEYSKEFVKELGKCLVTNEFDIITRNGENITDRILKIVDNFRKN